MQQMSKNLVETDRDLKAYIYQQLVELQPYLSTDSQMAVTVQQVLPADALQAHPGQTNARAREQTHKQAREKTLAQTSGKGGKKQRRQVKLKKKNPDIFVVTLSTKIEGGRLKAEGHSSNVYEAFSEAKDIMMQQLSQIQNALIDSAAREEEIQSYLNGSRVLH
jgi:ribosome-associated translation inhibitor RaiA